MSADISYFTRDVLEIIKNIPKGKVLTYGGIARLAGNPRAARQISRILHSMSRKYNLPWYRVVNSKGAISITSAEGLQQQKQLLEQEGVTVSDSGEIDLAKYLWDIDAIPGSGK